MCFINNHITRLLVFPEAASSLPQWHAEARGHLHLHELMSAVCVCVCVYTESRTPIDGDRQNNFMGTEEASVISGAGAPALSTLTGIKCGGLALYKRVGYRKPGTLALLVLGVLSRQIGVSSGSSRLVHTDRRFLCQSIGDSKHVFVVVVVFKYLSVKNLWWPTPGG